jgi:hypothetical protein
MSDILQYRRVTELEYRLGEGRTKINLEGTSNNYFSKVDDVQIDPKCVALSHLVLNTDGIRLKFASPIICNIETGKHYSSMMCGVKLEGDDKEAFVEKIDGLKKRLTDE